MRSMEWVQQSKLSSIFFQKGIIKILEFYLQTVHLHRFIFFILYFFLGLEHRMKWLQIILSLWIKIIKVSSCLSFERNCTWVTNCRLYGCCLFGWNDTKSFLWNVWSVYIFANSTVSDWSICWILSHCFKHNK